MTTFKRFTELSREIRDRIWTLAIRDDRPGVHIFGEYKTASHRIESWGGTSFYLAAPSWSRYFESLDEHRSDENISTYLIDGGLWTACHESRCIMEKHFKQSERRPNLRPRYEYGITSSEKERFKRATSGYFDGAPLEIVTVFPNRDLFILQHDDFDKVDWLCLGYEVSLASTREEFGAVGHIAIEYDRSWGDGIRIDYELLHACVGANYTMWFIDRSLKRKSQAPVFKEESDCSWKLNSFYASDRKFLAITGTDELLDDWEYIGPVETNWYNQIYDSLSFVCQLESDLTDRYIAGGLEAEKPGTVGLLGWAPL
ncbi:Ff.00g130960.m01.CDS01 [Fusarium sp. VM40]|nr:Ff.00g130960.m01.CDS01 [Fusarium sp. VM40]